MHVAIIGAGFAGLATAYFLTQWAEISVTLFEQGHIGAGASGAASGLLHPYAGLSARRSHRAQEALQMARDLLGVAQAHTSKPVRGPMGIYRQSVCDEQHQRLLSHAQNYGDVEQIGSDLFHIHSGMTVFSSHYLEGLWHAVENRGAKMCYEEVGSLAQLGDFNHVVIAAGYGIRHFPECAPLKVTFLKGQALTIGGTPPVEKSLISKGYLAYTGTDCQFEVGSTYERKFSHPHPDLTAAKGLLATHLQPYRDRPILACKSGVRVCRVGHYLPIVQRVAPHASVFTALGSRGLLYHGLLGRNLANQIAQNSSDVLN